MIGRTRWIAAVALALTFGQAGNQREYVDATRRFSFSYPEEFGATSPGTNDGFEDRVAAIRFAVFSTTSVGGEAALTRGLPVVDIQAAEGLYDPITLEAFPQPMRRLIVEALTPLSAANFCQQIAIEQHLDPQNSSLSSLTSQQKSAVNALDRMRSVSPRVLTCAVDGATVTFDKEAGFQPGGPRQHVYGAIRFLDRPYSTFQIVRAGPAPAATVLRQMAALVRSWNRL